MQAKIPLWYNLLDYWCSTKVPPGSGLTIPFLIGAQANDEDYPEITSIKAMLEELETFGKTTLIHFCNNIGEYVCCLTDLTDEEKKSYVGFGNLFLADDKLSSMSSLTQVCRYFESLYTEPMLVNRYSKNHGQWTEFTESDHELVSRIKMNMRIDHTGLIRRTDFRLRSEFPEIATTIYQLDGHKYTIHVRNNFDPLKSIDQKFNHSIKPVIAPVALAETVPSKFDRIISGIPDSEASKHFEGISMTRFDLMSLLMAKFPLVHFNRIEQNHDTVRIVTSAFKEPGHEVIHHRFLSVTDRKRIQIFLTGLRMGTRFELVEEETDGPPRVADLGHPNPVQTIYPSAFFKKTIPEFAQRDEAIWYDNIDQIFQGEFQKTNLFFYDSKEYSCYVDYSTFENIDIRNFIFLFETIYITPPISRDLQGWLKERKIKKHEFIELVKRGRIKVLLTQPEARYDVGFLSELFQEAPEGIVSRRALAALQQIDVVQLANNYLLNDENVIGELLAVSTTLGNQLHIESRDMYELLVWPLKAKRKSFEVLNRSGSFGVPAFGVNRAIEPSFSSAIKRDVGFEFTVCAPAIHLSHALNAIYFPFIAKDGFSDAPYANMMGGVLNLYRNATSKTVNSLAENEKELESGVLPISPIEIIEVNDFDSILDIENVLSKDVIFPNSKRLIETLASLTADERKKKIDLYNAEVNRKIASIKKRKQYINLAESGAQDIGGAATGFGALGFITALLKWTHSGAIKNISLYKHTLHKMEEALYSRNSDQTNIHYLTKINRVAKLKDFD